MKKPFLISIIIVLTLLSTIFFCTKNYSKNVNDNMFHKKEEIQVIWKNLFGLTNKRMQIINNLYIKYNCDKNKYINTIDSISVLKKSSENYMKKDFNSLEIKVNLVLLNLYNCENINNDQINALLKPYNDSLSIEINNYNNLVNNYNSEIFRFPNNLFIDNERYVSKRFFRINYSNNNLKNEIKKQMEIETWIKTGELPEN